jgi:DNA-directed RNA polymerase specialized sigma subunit
MKYHDEHFRKFAQGLEAAIAFYRTEGEHYNVQKAQVERLFNLEVEFKTTLIAHERGPSVYEDFVAFIRDVQRNILAARPYFRERQDTFRAEIAPILRDRVTPALYKFNLNYPFIALVMKRNPWLGEDPVFANLAKAIAKARDELITTNIPLAISRARVFERWRQRHLEYMDLVQIATEGLVAAIDKFVLPYGKNYGAVMYGRITGDLTEGNSETLLHFYPSDKRRIYAANKLVKEGKSFEEIADKLTQETGESVDSNDLQQLHIAAVTVSGDSQGSGYDHESEGMEQPMVRFQADESWRPDVQFEDAEVADALKSAIHGLTIFEKKLLRLKGVSV